MNFSIIRLNHIKNLLSFFILSLRYLYHTIVDINVSCQILNTATIAKLVQGLQCELQLVTRNLIGANRSAYISAIFNFYKFQLSNTLYDGLWKVAQESS